MRLALGAGLLSPLAMQALPLVEKLEPIAANCVERGWGLWLRLWPESKTPDPWIVLSALCGRHPGISLGLIAGLPAATRIADLEDLAVLNNLSDGRVDFAIEAGTGPDAIDEALKSLQGKSLQRTDGEGIVREFKITPSMACKTVTAWAPERSQTASREADAVWKRLPEEKGPNFAVLRRHENRTTGKYSAATKAELTIFDMPIEIQIADLREYMRRQEQSYEPT
jgi:hypothetical protein